MAAATVTEKKVTATDIVKWCGNNLGIDYDDDVRTPAWKRVSVEAGKLNAQTKRTGVTLDDLMVTARWCAQHRVLVTSPSGLVYHVEKAKADQQLPDVQETAVDSDLRDAILAEIQRREAGDADAAKWISRLQRSIGPYREQALADWRAARG